MSDIKLRSQHVKMLTGKHKTVRDRNDGADITYSPQQYLKLREIFLQVANTTAGSFQCRDRAGNCSCSRTTGQKASS